MKLTRPGQLRSLAAYPRCSADSGGVGGRIVLTKWPQGLKSLWRSFRLATSASRLFGRALKLERAGRKEEALDVARHALTLFHVCSGQRHAAVVKPAVQSTHAMLTVQAERLAQELNREGSEPSDLANAIAFLRQLPDEPEDRATRVKRECLPYLEDRLDLASRTGAN
jgi:hypothetical protein